MAKIPAIVWIVVGAVVLFFSYRIGTSFSAFLYLGALFILIGVFKLIFSRKKEVPVQHPAHHIQHHGHYCPRCRYQVHPTDNFCKNCGHRLR